MGKSTWAHKCPKCGKKVFWQFLYCADCRDKDKLLRNFKLRSSQTLLKGKRLAGVVPLKFWFVLELSRDHLVCIACNQKFNTAVTNGHTDFRHRCYSYRDMRLHKRKCFVCKSQKEMSSFAILKVSRQEVRSRICTDCMSEKTVFVVGRNVIGKIVLRAA